jgi:predicted nucleic acid-binding protein
MPDHILCDTCVLIDYINGRNPTLNDFLNNSTILFINSIIEMEILQGARNKQELQIIKKNY